MNGGKGRKTPTFTITLLMAMKPTREDAVFHPAWGSELSP